MTQEIISAPPELPAWPAAEEAEELEAPHEQRHYSVDEAGHGLRIDKSLALRCPEFSRGYFQQLLEDGAVRLNGKVLGKPSTKLRIGDRVEVELRPTAQAQAFLPEPMALNVVFEDEHLLVIDKPAGLVVHPAAGNWTGTLLNGLLAYHAGAARLPRAGIVHRLDKDTSGLMLVGKTLPAVEALVRLIAQREVHRIYVALAQGCWKHGDEVLVNQALGRDPRNRLRMAVLDAASTAAKPAQTTVRVLDRSNAAVWVGCKLHTGRTHQIRVHMAWLGHPLVGDATYGGKAHLGLNRQALHAHRLVLRHPITQDALSLQSPLPEDLHNAVREAGLHYNLDQLWQVDPT
ncbi:MAG TPA: RluA family pseudouridine synthase [Macromonas sp.]|nr:RluA family pseudouridine synthase [Macromonas sp.]